MNRKRIFDYDFIDIDDKIDNKIDEYFASKMRHNKKKKILVSYTPEMKQSEFYKLYENHFDK